MNSLSENLSDRISEIDRCQQKVSALGRVHRVNWKNKDFRNLQEQFASATHGFLYRNTLAGEEYWHGDEDDFLPWNIKKITMEFYNVDCVMGYNRMYNISGVSCNAV